MKDIYVKFNKPLNGKDIKGLDFQRPLGDATRTRDGAPDLLALGFHPI